MVVSTATISSRRTAGPLSALTSPAPPMTELADAPWIASASVPGAAMEAGVLLTAYRPPACERGQSCFNGSMDFRGHSVVDALYERLCEPLQGMSLSVRRLLEEATSVATEGEAGELVVQEMVEIHIDAEKWDYDARSSADLRELEAAVGKDARVADVVLDEVERRVTERDLGATLEAEQL